MRRVIIRLQRLHDLAGDGGVEGPVRLAGVAAATWPTSWSASTRFCGCRIPSWREDLQLRVAADPGAMVFLGGTPTDRNLATRGAEPFQPRRLRRGRDGHSTAMYAAMALNHLGS